MIIGYGRVSQQDQSLIRQLDMLKNYGVEKIYQEKTQQHFLSIFLFSITLLTEAGQFHRILSSEVRTKTAMTLQTKHHLPSLMHITI